VILFITVMDKVPRSRNTGLFWGLSRILGGAGTAGGTSPFGIFWASLSEVGCMPAAHPASSE